MSEIKPLEATLTIRNNRLKKLRLSYGLSQKEMAKLIGINLPFYGAAETLKEIPTHIIDKICSFFELERSYLFPKENENVKSKTVKEISIEDFSLEYKNHLLMLNHSNKKDEIFKESYDMIEKVLDTLNERERYVIKERFGLNESRTPKTISEVAKSQKISSMRVLQVTQKAIQKMRHPFRSRPLKEFINEPISNE